MFWVHRGLQFPSVQILRAGGIHLNKPKEGNLRLLSSIRGALLYVQTYVNGNTIRSFSVKRKQMCSGKKCKCL